VVTGSRPKQCNLNNVRREASRHFRYKKNDHQKAKVYELKTNSKLKKIRTCIEVTMIMRSVTSLEPI
jgi:hypothetical protein